MPPDLAIVHAVLVMAMILLLGATEHDEHGHWDHKETK